GDRREAQVEFAKPRQLRDGFETEVAGVRRFEIQLLERGERRQILQLRIRDRRPRERHARDAALGHADLPAERLDPVCYPAFARTLCRRAARELRRGRCIHIGNLQLRKRCLDRLYACSGYAAIAKIEEFEIAQRLELCESRVCDTAAVKIKLAKFGEAR